MPEGSIVIGAGNRVYDGAMAKPMNTALVNRMLHVRLRVSHRDWLKWAAGADIHPWVYDMIVARPDFLVSPPPKTEEPFSTPRRWHFLSDDLYAYGEEITDAHLKVLAAGYLFPAHTQQFCGFVKHIRGKYDLARILKGEMGWPRDPADGDVLYFLAELWRWCTHRNRPPEHDDVGLQDGFDACASTP
ncbi:MAG TPA: hypothetical protein VF178_15270 [Gemmatimonadaceae bacterium]